MKKLILSLSILILSISAQAQNIAQIRAASFKKGMNLAVWLESGYWYFNTTTFPDVNRYTEADIKNLHDLCFQTVRLPVFFEPFAGTTAPYTFDMSNQNVARGINYVDSVIVWTNTYGMNLIIDNHLADDDNTYGLQTNFQITDNNYTTQAALMAAVWKQVVQRYAWTNPNKVFYELRNEPNNVSDANLRVVYQTMIDTIRQYDQTHTLIVGNTGYYDPIALSTSTPYSDNNLIYTFHIYDGNTYPGFCFQGVTGVPATDTLAGPHTSFALHGAQAADITSEVQAVHNWSIAHGVPVWLGEFGCTSLPEVYGDDTSRCNYINNFATILDNTNTPWCYWDGYGPDEYVTSYDGGTTLTYLFSMFDRNNTLTESHLDPCFRLALHIGSACDLHTGIQDNKLTDVSAVTLYPNPSNSHLYIKAPAPASIQISNILGGVTQTLRYENDPVELNTSPLPSGIYLATFHFDDGRYITSRFTKE